jgi:hypothetical protein
MKIVDYNTFVRLPAGTVFSPYMPCSLEGDLEIKVDGGHAYEAPCFPEGWYFNGTMTLSPWFEDPSLLLGLGDEAPASFEVYDGSNVDYRDYKMFLIFEDSDVERLIKVLEWARSGCKDPNPGEV